MLLFPLPAFSLEDSCTGCHLHQSFREDFQAGMDDTETLAGIHGKEEGFTCRKCHDNLQESGKLPSGNFCEGCHYKDKTSQGNPEHVFHAEAGHWDMNKAVCTDCHKAHTQGNHRIKFLSGSAVMDVCKRCHEKTFR